MVSEVFALAFGALCFWMQERCVKKHQQALPSDTEHGPRQNKVIRNGWIMSNVKAVPVERKPETLTHVVMKKREHTCGNNECGRTIIIPVGEKMYCVLCTCCMTWHAPDEDGYSVHKMSKAELFQLYSELHDQAKELEREAMNL